MSIAMGSFLETLSWCIFSPDLVQLNSKSLDSDFLKKGWKVFEDASFPQQNLPNYNGRLGHFFEDFIDFFLSHHPDVTTLQRGRQIKKDNQTIGEADFLFYDHSAKEWIHLEVAVKFYLLRSNLTSDDANASIFLGPNAIDNLKKKRDKLFFKQMKLIEENRSLLPDLPLDAPLKSKLLFKGILFYPLSQEQIEENMCLRMGISPLHIQGKWMHRLEIADLKLKNVKYLFLDRSSWFRQLSLAEIQNPGLDQTEFNEFIDRHFSYSQQPLMFERFLGSSNYKQQRLRICIVHENWPKLRDE